MVALSHVFVSRFLVPLAHPTCTHYKCGNFYNNVFCFFCSGEPGAPSPSKADKSRLYVMRTLAPPSGWSQQGPQRSTEKVERPFWWEVLCLLKSHVVEMVEEVMVTLGDKTLKVCTSCLVCE